MKSGLLLWASVSKLLYHDLSVEFQHQWSFSAQSEAVLTPEISLASNRASMTAYKISSLSFGTLLFEYYSLNF